MRDFSVFELTSRLAATLKPDDLGTVSQLARRDFEERRTFRFRAQAPCLEYMSLLIESALLLRTNRTGRLYAGFGRLSRMEPVTDRFLRIADVSERVCIFGEPDWEPPRHPRIKIVRLTPESKLVSEWFLIADSSTLSVVLAAKEEQVFDASAQQGSWFSAAKSSEPSLVRVVSLAAENRMDEIYMATGDPSVSI